MDNSKFKRVMFKISGEALSGSKHIGIDTKILGEISDRIKQVRDMNVEIGIVVGGGNFWRGRSSKEMDRTTADHMGMLATVLNSLAMKDALESRGVEVRVQTAIEMRQIAEPYIRGRAVRHLEKGRVVIFACGTGNPYFSTDTAAALRAAEIDAEILLCAKNVDGVYDKDPGIYPDAVKYESISYGDVLKDQLTALDLSATSLCMENKIPVAVFGIDPPENIVKIVKGEHIGTMITNLI